MCMKMLSKITLSSRRHQEHIEGLSINLRWRTYRGTTIPKQLYKVVRQPQEISIHLTT